MMLVSYPGTNLEVSMRFDTYEDCFKAKYDILASYDKPERLLKIECVKDEDYEKSTRPNN